MSLRGVGATSCSNSSVERFDWLWSMVLVIGGSSIRSPLTFP
ncbi:hypothetical protein [Bacillus thuringiensis]|nr:hypothetical protein [Bacillus thuringiensis]